MRSYADLLNAEALDAFLKVTHERYAARFAKNFGEFMPGIFTDEPHFRCGDLPWTDQFPSYFRRLNGYDILPRLPDLFFDLPNSPKARYDFWRTATKTFVEIFSRRLYDWCEAQGIGLTGHYLREDNLLSEMLHAGAVMPHYEFQQYRGIDHLGRNINNPLTLKRVSSVAHQLGRRRVLCEIYGVSGHSMTFEDQKWIADFHFALGINFICQHLVLYSIKGERKRDYPPTISYHQPYWPHCRYMNDYLARCSYAISVGKSAAELLLLHPMPTAWTVWRKGKDEAAADYNQRFVSLLTWLLEIHRTFDLGDELIMGRHALAGRKRLSVGKMKYKAVIVPPSKNWGPAILELLKQFGGPIVFVGEIPSMTGGKKTSEWKNLLEKKNVFSVKEDEDEIASLLDKLIARDISITDDSGREISDIYVNHRLSGDGRQYFLANTNRSERHAATLRLASRGKVNEWNPCDGSVREVEAAVSGENTVLRLELLSAGSKILTVERVGRGKKAAKLEELERIPISGPWSFRRTHPNSLTLDFCRVSINDSSFGEMNPVWKARREIQKFFGLEEYQGIQPWGLDEKKIKLDPKNSVQLQFEFEVRNKPRKIYVVVEEAFKFGLRVNGKDVDTRTDEWHWDRQFSKINISKQLVKGKNTINLRCNYQWDTETEDVYLVGDFGVQSRGTSRFCLVEEPRKLEAGDWRIQGYPFYSGNMVYEAEVQIAKARGRIYLLDISKVKGCLCRVAVNGKDAGLVAWHPWRIDVTRLVKKGRNSIQVEVVSSLRNTMGPLHHKAKDDLPWVGPEQFVDEANWTDEYNFVPYGIFGAPELLICREAK